MSPASCSAWVPTIATAIARSHMRMRAQLPMFTTSETAPIVQKLVRFATAPKTNAIANPAQATSAPTCELLPKRPPRCPSILVRGPVARGIGHARGTEAFAAEAAGVARPARRSLRIRLVARDRERVVDAQRHAAAHD